MSEFNGTCNGHKHNSEPGIKHQVIDPRFECPICLTCLREPYLTICGHRFCQQCILMWLEKKGSVCPVDGRVLKKETDLFLDNYTKREISDQIIKCPYPNCKHISPLLEYEQHLLQVHEIVSPTSSKVNNFQFNGEANGEEENESLWMSPGKYQSKADEATKLLIKSLFERLVILEQKSLEQENQLKTAKDKIAEMQNERLRFEAELALKVCNGTYVWNITDVKSKIRFMCKDSANTFYSDGFYTSYTGYKFCARIYVTPQQKYLSLWTHIMKGDNDHTLSWPFSGRICFTLIHPTKPENSLREKMCSRPDVEAFKRPKNTINMRGFGYNEFISLSDLTSQEFLNESDTLNIKIQINVV
ncbi:TNF receptor-associated factor 6 isoform X2 [Cimex lectularius]|uniref:TNF receptor-associated factor 6 n=1 Tax=Cimex lectularius TaxID=79782 RepID=A0A8I6TGF3_CIMLE|nr:TNF receptor-associated factor 6 isoform X2 [Cimex lectularius]